MPLPLVLASSSVHRRALLDRLQIDYDICSPGIDETRRTDEAPHNYVARLSREKAAAVADRHPRALVIGSDQAAVIGSDVLGKPGDHQRAAEQLQRASGRTVDFYTALTLLNTDTGRAHTDTVTTTVYFRRLTDQTIERYLQKEHPYDCAGSFKSEGLGIALFERIDSEDPTALIGLPLIRLVSMLAAEGVPIP
jgi:septum formation protein